MPSQPSRILSKVSVGLYTAEPLTNHCHLAAVRVGGVLDVLGNVQRLGPLLLGGVGAIELEDLGLGVQDKHIRVSERGAGKGDLGDSNSRKGVQKSNELRALALSCVVPLYHWTRRHWSWCSAQTRPSG